MNFAGNGKGNRKKAVKVVKIKESNFVTLWNIGVLLAIENV